MSKYIQKCTTCWKKNKISNSPTFNGGGRGGGVKTKIFHFKGGSPPPHLEVFHLPKVKYFSQKKKLSIRVSGRGWIQGWMSCSEGCLASSVSYLLSGKPAVTIYLVVCLRVSPTRVRTKKVQKGTASACRIRALVLRKMKRCVIPSLG